jgi:hypothetical protein
VKESRTFDLITGYSIFKLEGSHCETIFDSEENETSERVS